ncbi:DNA-deoxyinosine glycosylase [Nitrincola tapanii]|uniref:DNA-deoxyinosine glycosylase n=1 Tax=Nitrincola tapanii TaxID=1708751 RepID=A0A5A9W4T1_9GAMM|nr:DNA-deoxyinosine glycosylase [Nitrincola tapanii]KAA0875790.1 DNA-deoxyinosine glycosylase [Nitrincola tapanii]
MAQVQSFAPWVDEASRVLILGSMPGVASLQAQAYYAHPRNVFWPILADLLGFEAQAPYAERLQQLRAQGVGLWDVLQSCERPGSLDSAIRQSTRLYNDLAGLLVSYPNIQAVFCNGTRAYQEYQRYCKLVPQCRIEQAIRLPSTSPAHASLSFAAKKQAWQPLLSALKRGSLE